MEGSLSDTRHFDGPLNGFMGSREVAADLKAMGFDLVNRANNHLFDSEAAGMFATNRLLDEAGVGHAGSGPTLSEAAAPTFLDLAKGRVAYIGMHTPNGVASERLAASERTGNLGGRPGLNMLHYTDAILVSPQQLADLKRIRGELLESRTKYDNPRQMGRNEPDDRIVFPSSSSGREDETFRAAKPGETPGTLDFTMNRADLARILRSVRNAKKVSDFTIATIHAHQNQSVAEEFHLSTRPPAFLIDLAHQTIDNGADAFVGHGPHTLRGIEIYKGKPIFYGMSEFFREMQWELDEEFGQADGSSASRNANGSQSHESILGVSRFESGSLTEVRVYPIDLRYDGPDSTLGIPRIATGELGKKILERVQRLSKELGTTISIENGVGLIRLPASQTRSGR
jgi:poly-gamma-glutamate capsule biosynthesis protein CapA/YwtB (metallophosphatase superfamily)